MLQVAKGNKFNRDLKKVRKRNLDESLLIWVIGELMNENPLPEKYRDHALTGNYKDFRECHIQPDWLLIYKIHDDTLYLARTGTHADLF